MLFGHEREPFSRPTDRPTDLIIMDGRARKLSSPIRVFERCLAQS
jgi:hypothetical protein